MRRRTVAIVILAALIATPVLAPALAKDEPKPDQDQTVKLSPVALPVMFDGKVINYIFVEVRLLLTPSADAIALRDKEPYFRDALVRAAYRTPFLAAGDPNRIDETKLKAALMREAAAIAGPHMIAAVVLESQTPQHRLSLAKPGPPPIPPPADIP